MTTSPTPSITYDQLAQQADTFDLLLFHGTSQMSQGIEAATGGQYSHAAMIFRPDPSSPPLIWQTSIDNITQDMEGAGGFHPGSQLNQLDHALSVIYRGYVDIPYYRQYQGPRTASQRAGAAAFIKAHDDVPFGTIFQLMANYLCARLLDNQAVVPSNEVFCAELVAMTFHAAGLLGDQHPPSWYSPNSWGEKTYEVNLAVGSFGPDTAIDTATIPTPMEPLQPPVAS
ncbi:MAG: hypothetical protein H6513_07280 [Acidimicrobiaceae bacterium]|nr:hypothetical protein [Ilumatobacter sp.]MCB9380480.1 hypothetical protein [Acidimicrobiaceae bacterium]MCO5329620.1 hypothetical protein [Ilumatobacteraceae bacterium]